MSNFSLKLESIFPVVKLLICRPYFGRHFICRAFLLTYNIVVNLFNWPCFHLLNFLTFRSHCCRPFSLVELFLVSKPLHLSIFTFVDQIISFLIFLAFQVVRKARSMTFNIDWGTGLVKWSTLKRFWRSNLVRIQIELSVLDLVLLEV